MKRILPYNGRSLPVADMLKLSRQLVLPWMSRRKDASELMQVSSYDPYIEAIKANGSVEMLYRLSDYNDVTVLLRPDAEDGIDGDKTLMEGVTTKDVASSLVDNTRSDDINKENERFNSFLESRRQAFIQMLTWVDFEDGMENEVTRLVSGYMKKNRYVTYCWLNKVFSDYRQEPIITSGILRTLVMVVNKSDADYMLPMVTVGLSSKYSEDQEAAIMVVEKWRTKECLDALLSTTYGSDWVKEYALQVAAELKEELGG